MLMDMYYCSGILTCKEHVGMCRLNGLLFHLKSLNMNPGVNFKKKKRKKTLVKSSIFEEEKPEKMGPIC